MWTWFKYLNLVARLGILWENLRGVRAKEVTSADPHSHLIVEKMPLFRIYRHTLQPSNPQQILAYSLPPCGIIMLALANIKESIT